LSTNIIFVRFLKQPICRAVPLLKRIHLDENADKPDSALGPGLEPKDCFAREVGDGGARRAQLESKSVAIFVTKSEQRFSPDNDKGLTLNFLSIEALFSTLCDLRG
jgi:hypothetical protein